MMRICENGITRDMTAAEIAAWQRSVVGLAPTATDAELAAAQVEVVKKTKLIAIDTKTSVNIASGYLFNNKRFSASSNHQTWALGILTGIAAGIDYTGIKVSTIDNQSFHTIVDNTDAANLAKTCINHVKNWLASGSDLKDQVANASTIEEINAIIDNR